MTISETKTKTYEDTLTEWASIEASTEPADRPRAEATIKKMYQLNGLPEPVIVWCQSPVELAFSRWATIVVASAGDQKDMMSQSMIDEYKLAGGQQRLWFRDRPLMAAEKAAISTFGGKYILQMLNKRLDNNWGASFYSAIRYPQNSHWEPVAGTATESADEQNRDNIRSPLVNDVAGPLGQAVIIALRKKENYIRLFNNAFDNLEKAMETPIDSSSRAQVLQNFTKTSPTQVYMSTMNNSLYGNFDARRLALLHYLSTERRDIYDPYNSHFKLEPLFELARYCSPVLPHKHICWATERPAKLVYDNICVPHSADSPAIVYPDGLEIWCFRGLAVERELLDKAGEITVEQIDSEKNIILRRVLIELFGEERFILEGGAEITDHDERYGTLYVREVPNDDPVVMVKVRNTTPEPDGEHKHYFLHVPPHIKSAKEAVAWTFQMEESEYEPTEEA